MDEEKSGSSTIQKKMIYYTVGLAVGYFRPPCGHSRRIWHCRGRAGARHSICELTHGMAGERHAMCESALSVHISLSLGHTHTHTFSVVLVQPIPNTGLEAGLVTDVGYKLLIIAHFVALLRGLWWSGVWQEVYCPLHDVSTEERKWYRVRSTLRKQCRSRDSDGVTGCTAEKSWFKSH